MRLTQWTWAALAGLATAVANETLGSRNILPSVFRPAQNFRNVNLVRNINLEKNYVHETINVVVENIHDAPQSEYYLPFEEGVIARVGGLEVKDKKDAANSGFLAEVVAVDPASTTQFYKIVFPQALAPKAQLTLSISYYVLSALHPRPAQIGQSDQQYVEFAFSAYAPSAYETGKQKTKLKLPTTDVPDATVVPASLNAEGKEDPQKQGSTYTYGPYDSLQAGAVQDVTIRYEFTKPLTHGTLLERDIEVSHWGNNIAFEERHWLTNRAASLKDHFSRVTWQQHAYYNPPTAALKELRFPLAVGSVDAYFIDDIGNVSTSRFRTSSKEANLELKPRYPLFGNWNYSFKVGWNLDLNKVLRKVKGASNAFVLKVPLLEGPKQAEGVEYERVVTRIILPEGVINVKFETDVPLVSNTVGLHRTFMDTVGRTSLELVAMNLVDDLRTRAIVVTYELPAGAQFRKPFTIAGGALAVFVACWVVGNLDVSIGRKPKAA